MKYTAIFNGANVSLEHQAQWKSLPEIIGLMNNEESFVFRHQKLYFGGHTTLTNEGQGPGVLLDTPNTRSSLTQS